MALMILYKLLTSFLKNSVLGLKFFFTYLLINNHSRTNQSEEYYTQKIL